MREVAPRSDLTREVRGDWRVACPKISNLIHRPPLLFVIGMRAAMHSQISSCSLTAICLQNDQNECCGHVTNISRTKIVLNQMEEGASGSQSLGFSLDWLRGVNILGTQSAKARRGLARGG